MFAHEAQERLLDKLGRHEWSLMRTRSPAGAVHRPAVLAHAPHGDPEVVWAELDDQGLPAFV